jgi:hypothetical protein
MTTIDFNAMSGPELARTYNEMAMTAIDLGSDKYKTVQRFADARVGRARCEALHSHITALRASAAAVDADAGRDIRPAFLKAKETKPDASPAETEARSEDEMARKKTKAKKELRAKTARTASKARAPRADGAKTLNQYTEEWNELVPAAVKLGIKGAKHHTSAFESVAKAEARIEWLRERIAEAKAA